MSAMARITVQHSSQIQMAAASTPSKQHHTKHETVTDEACGSRLEELTVDPLGRINWTDGNTGVYILDRATGRIKVNPLMNLETPLVCHAVAMPWFFQVLLCSGALVLRCSGLWHCEWFDIAKW